MLELTPPAGSDAGEPHRINTWGRRRLTSNQCPCTEVDALHETAQKVSHVGADAAIGRVIAKRARVDQDHGWVSRWLHGCRIGVSRGGHGAT